MGKAAIGQYASETSAVRVHRGIDDSMLARGVLWQHGRSRPVRRQRAEQPAAREGRAGQGGKTERPVLPRKPGNAGGGKGPWFKGHAQRSKGKEIGVSLTTPESVWQLQEALHANVCESMNTLERKPDARNGHVRFDERGVETERMAGYSGTGNRKGRTRLRPAFTPPRHSSTLHNQDHRVGVEIRLA
jgi:hypothetical protein